jgi:hypothetical protein
MVGSRCRVSFTDSEGVLHGVDVDAESLYEAAGSLRTLAFGRCVL